MNIFKKIFKSKKGSELASKLMVGAFAVAMGGAVIVWTSNVIIEAKNKPINGVLDGSGEVADGYIPADQGTEGLNFGMFFLKRTDYTRYQVTSYEGTSPTVIIPSTIGEVTSYDGRRTGMSRIERIADEAFMNNTLITSVTVPSSVNRFGDSAFDGCYSLSSINVSSSVTYIGEYAFSECHSLTEIYIPNSVTTIGADCFDGCSSNLVIRCGHPSQPEGFGGNWDGGHQVVWGV